MEQQATESQKLAEEKAFYRIISYKGSELPVSYEGLVYSRFLRGLRYGNVLFRLMEPESYHFHYHTYLENVLKRKDTWVKLAVLSDDLDNVLGYSIQEGHTLHWVHVHKNNRKAGIATELVWPKTKVITNLTHTGFSIWNRKYKSQIIFNPFA